MSESGRCAWADSDPAMREYHDREWGVPLHDERALFELLTLEGAQAGLSWSTILRRRDGYRTAFANFEIERVAGLGDDDLERLMADTGIIRNRQKIQATRTNARLVVELQRSGGTLDTLVWSFVDGRPIDHRFTSMAELPGGDRGERSDEQGAAEARLRVRRADHLLRLHAGSGARQ